MESISNSCRDFLITKETNDFVYATRHEPVALEEVGLQGLSHPTLPLEISRLHQGFQTRQEDGKSVLSKEQLFAVCLALNSHQKTFRGRACFELQANKLELDGILQEFPEEQQAKLLEVQPPCIMPSKDRFSNVKEFRRGFWLGDSNGFGKTRIIAGILAQYFCRGLLQAIYVSESEESWNVLKKELEAIKFSTVVYYDIGSNSPPLPGTGGKQLKLLHVPFRRLAGDDTMQKIQEWAGPDSFRGSIIIDELDAVQWTESNVRLGLTELQDIFDDSRVVLACPADCLQLENFWLLWRLGLFAEGTHFETPGSLYGALSQRGKFGHTQVLMELKMKGQMICRHLSFQNAEVRLASCDMNEDFGILYEFCANLWRLLYEQLKYITGMILKSSAPAPDKWNTIQKLASDFVSNRQSFFRMLVISSKLANAEKVVKEALLTSLPVVLGLPSDPVPVDFCMRNRTHKVFDGIAYSSLMMKLRRTMVDLGIPVGYPKLCLADGSMPYLNRVDDSSELELIAIELAGSALRPVLTFIETDLAKDDENVKHCQQTDYYTITQWLPYSIGATLKHPKLVSPERLFLSQLGTLRTSHRKGLANLFHQLYMFLPITPSDETKDRLTRLLKEMYPYQSRPDWITPTVADVTGRSYECTWNEETQVWDNQLRNDHFDEDYGSFVRGESKVLLYSFRRKFEGLPQRSEWYQSAGKMRCAHVMLDFSVEYLELIKQASLTHRCGQQDDSIYYLLSASEKLPGDLMCVGQLAKFFEDRGAFLMMDTEWKGGLMDVELFTERGVLGMNEVADTFPKDLCKAVWPRHWQSTQHIETTQGSNQKMKDMLSRLGYLPPSCQCQLLGKLKEWIFMSHVEEYIPGSFREIPQTYDITLEQKELVNVKGNECEVFLFRLSRLYPVDFLDELVKAVECKFYVDDVNYPICVAYPCKGGMKVRYPFSNLPVDMSLDKWASKRLERVSEAEGRKLWIDALEQFAKKRNLCGHGRLKQSKPCPLGDESKRKCTFQWGTSRVLLMTGCFSGLLDDLDEYEIPWQHAKMTVNYKVPFGEGSITIDSTTYVGLYIGHENFRQSPKDAWREIVSLSKKNE